MVLLEAKPVVRISCPVCGRFLGSTDGSYFEPPPCKCGVSVIVRLDKKRQPR